jgi:Leucine-rich repeat (LRR) protein
MTRIFLIAVFVAIFAGCSLGQNCKNRGTETDLEISDCNPDSFKELVQSFGARNIVVLETWSNQNNTFQTIDAEM